MPCRGLIVLSCNRPPNFSAVRITACAMLPSPCEYWVPGIALVKIHSAISNAISPTLAMPNSDHRLQPFRCPISSTYHGAPAARDLRKRKLLASAELRRSLVELEPECRLILAFSPTRVILRTHGPARYGDEFRRQTG